MNTEIVFFMLGIGLSSGVLYTFFFLKKDFLINKEVQKQLGIFEETELKEKIIKIIEINEDEFNDIISDGVKIFFNPSLDGPDCNDREVVPDNISSFFEEIAEDMCDAQEYW